MKLRKFIILTIFPILTASFSFAGANDKGIEYYRADLYDAAKLFFLKQTNLSPLEQAENYYFLGITYFQLNQRDSASYYYQKAIEVLPTYPFGYVGEGKMQLISGNKKVAEELFKKASNFAKKDPSVQVAIAEVYLELGDFTNAHIALGKAKNINSKFSGIYIVEGDIFMKQGKEGEAASCYSNALYFNSSDKLAYLKLAKIYQNINANVALNNLEKLIKIDPDYIPAYATIADIHRDARNYKKALDALEKFISIPGVPMLQHEYYAQLLYFTDQFEKADNQIKYVLSKDPDNLVMKRIEAYNSFGMEKYDVGLAQMKKFLEVMPEERHIFLDYTTLAQLAYKEKQNQLALDAFKKALEIDTSKYELYKEMGAIAASLKLYQEAIEYYEKYIASSQAPDALDFLNLGNANQSAAAFYIDAANIASVKTPEEFEKFENEFKRFVQRGDRAFMEVVRKRPEFHYGYVKRANITSYLDAFDNSHKRKVIGHAKQLYEEALEFLEKNNPDGARNSDILTALNYLLEYYITVEDKTNMAEYSRKILQIDAQNERAKKVLEFLKLKR